MKNFKIKHKFYLCLGIILILTLGAGSTAIFSARGINDTFEEFYENSYLSYAHISSARIHFDNMAKALAVPITTDDKDLILAAHEQGSDEFQSFFENLEAIKALNTKAEVNEVLAKVEESANITESFRTQVADLVSNNLFDEARALYFGEFFTNFDQTLTHIEGIVSITNSNAGNTFIETDERNVFETRLLIAILTVTAILILALGYMLIKSFTTPLFKIKNSFDKLSKGNFSEAHIDYKSNDEFGELAENLRFTIENFYNVVDDLNAKLSKLADGNFLPDNENQHLYLGDFAKIIDLVHVFSKNIENTLHQVSDSSNSIMISSNQVSEAAQVLAEGASDQASSIEKLKDTISDISNQINKIDANAQNASLASESSEIAVSNSNQKMQEQMLSMQEIELKSNEISKIIKTIEDIAFQTNILALNAAVEAARAGEAGKSFAVVADEVRSLAVKSTEAAQNTTTLINASIEAINKGVSLSKVTANELLGVVDKAQETNLLINEISKETKMQSHAIIEAMAGVEAISNVVHTNASTSQESAATSTDLSNQATALNEIIANFKLSD